MDRPEHSVGPVQRQDDTATDTPMPLREDLHGLPPHHNVLPRYDSHVYESSWSGLPPDEHQPKPQGDSGTTEHERKKGPPPLPPRRRLPSAPIRPPPVPPRTRPPLNSCKKQISCDLTEPAFRLHRSRTEVDHYVSITSSFPVGQRVPVWLEKPTPWICSYLFHRRIHGPLS